MPEPGKARPPNDEYFYGIDLVRFACAMGVAAFHLTWMTPGIAWTLPFGWVGVEVFFVISGLVIANSAQNVTFQQFLASRFLRIYPAAWCVAAINYPLYLWQFPKNSPGLIQLYYSMILLPGPFLATAYWTLPVELAFYFLVYSVIVFHGLRYIQSIAIVLIVWGIPYLLALASNARGWVHWAWTDFDYGWMNLSLLRHGPYFGLGILIWLHKENKLKRIGVFAAFLAVFLAFLEIYARAVEVFPEFGRSLIATQAPWPHLALWSYLIFLLALCAILISVHLNQYFPASTGLRRTVRLLGLTTYPMYLLHERAGEFVLYQMRRVGMAPLSSAMVALGCTGLVSLVIAWFFEPALRNLFKRMGRSFNRDGKKPALQSR